MKKEFTVYKVTLKLNGRIKWEKTLSNKNEALETARRWDRDTDGIRYREVTIEPCTEFNYGGYTFRKGSLSTGVTSTGFKYSENSCYAIKDGLILCNIGTWKGMLYQFKRIDKIPAEKRFFDEKIKMLDTEYTPEKMAWIKEAMSI